MPLDNRLGACYIIYGGFMKTKKCTKCGEEKPATAEFFHRRGKGLQYYCKVCVTKYHRANRETIAERKKQHHQANRETIAERKKKHYQANREVTLELAKQYRHAKNAKQPACIYQIINTQNGRIYVGETIRGELRWKEHLIALRGGYHENSNIQADFNKFGEEVFEWSIIKELPKDKQVLLHEEIKTINSFLKEGKNLYNLVLTVDQLIMLQESENNS